jgi:hypothetical protein
LASRALRRSSRCDDWGDVDGVEVALYVKLEFEAWRWIVCMMDAEGEVLVGAVEVEAGSWVVVVIAAAEQVGDLDESRDVKIESECAVKSEQESCNKLTLKNNNVCLVCLVLSCVRSDLYDID